MRMRSVFISDIHLGFKGCSADMLLEFLHQVEMDYLFLVGDIVDLWSMKKTMFWPQSHNNVLRTILGKAKRGTKVIFVPGNHDELFRDFDGAVFGNLEIHRDYVHTTLAGRRIPGFLEGHRGARSGRQLADRFVGLYGVNTFGYDFYKDSIERGAARVRELAPVVGAYHPVVAYNVRRLCEISRLQEVSFHMSGTEAVPCAWLAITTGAIIWCAFAALITAGGAMCSRAWAIRARPPIPSPSKR